MVLKLLTEFVLRAFNKYIDRIDCHKFFQSIAEQNGVLKKKSQTVREVLFGALYLEKKYLFHFRDRAEEDTRGGVYNQFILSKIWCITF